MSVKSKVLYTAEAVVEGGEGGFTLEVSLDLNAPWISREEASELMARAHERCPYSNATRGNIDVSLLVDGQRI